MTAFEVLCFTEVRSTTAATSLVAVALYPRRLKQSELFCFRAGSYPFISWNPSSSLFVVPGLDLRIQLRFTDVAAGDGERREDATLKRLSCLMLFMAWASVGGGRQVGSIRTSPTASLKRAMHILQMKSYL